MLAFWMKVLLFPVFEIYSIRLDEEIDMKYIDSHVHLIDHGHFEYSFILPNMTIFQPNFTLAMFEDNTDSTPVKHAVLIESAADWKAELEYMLKISCFHESVIGIVAGIPLEEKSFQQILEKYSSGRNGQLLVGMRNYMKGGEQYYTNVSLWPALASLESEEKVLEIVLRPTELKPFTTVVKAFPKLKIIIEHMAIPLLDSSPIDIWKTGLAEMAKYPNVFIKISGLVHVDDTGVLFKGKTKVNNTLLRLQQFQPLVEFVLEVFGVDRCMYGSDWPIILVGYYNYPEIYNMTERLLNHLSAQDRHKIFYSNAVKIYNLPAEIELCQTGGAVRLSFKGLLLLLLWQCTGIIIYYAFQDFR